MTLSQTRLHFCNRARQSVVRRDLAVVFATARPWLGGVTSRVNHPASRQHWAIGHCYDYCADTLATLIAVSALIEVGVIAPGVPQGNPGPPLGRCQTFCRRLPKHVQNVLLDRIMHGNPHDDPPVVTTHKTSGTSTHTIFLGAIPKSP